MNRKDEKRTRCKYDNSRVSLTDETGRLNSYARCNMCGKWHKGKYGVILDFCVPDLREDGRTATSFDSREKLCRKCAAKLSNQLLALADILWNSNPKEDTSELGRKIDAAQRAFWERIASQDEEE